MKSLVLWSTIAILLSGQCYCQEPVTTSPTLLRLHEGKVRLSSQPGAESSSCLIVMTTGRVYIEKRSHLVREPKADLKVYSGQLSPDQMSALLRTLADEELQDAASARPEQMPQNEIDFSWIVAEIAKDSSMLKIDYRYWKGHAEEYNGASPSFAAKEQQVLKALTPLMQWADRVDLNGLKEIDFVPGMCIK
jgi:hypothetical protein